jgi:hypothetical protein
MPCIWQVESTLTRKEMNHCDWQSVYYVLSFHIYCRCLHEIFYFPKENLFDSASPFLDLVKVFFPREIS